MATTAMVRDFPPLRPTASHNSRIGAVNSRVRPVWRSVGFRLLGSQRKTEENAQDHPPKLPTWAGEAEEFVHHDSNVRWNQAAPPARRAAHSAGVSVASSGAESRSMMPSARKVRNKLEVSGARSRHRRAAL